MKEYSCPDCRAVIAHDDMNISKGVALCPKCGKILELIDLVERPSTSDCSRILLNEPPRGIKIVRDTMNPMGDITLTYRRVNFAVLFLIPFTALWGGLSVGAIYIGPLLKDGNIPMEQALIGLPFLFGTIVLLCTICTMLFGKKVLKLSHDKGSYATKVFGIGRTKHFDLNRNTIIEESQTNYEVNHRTLPQITITNGKKTVKMFADARPEALEYILAVLHSSAR